jgi:protoporphyrinogen oxidase
MAGRAVEIVVIGAGMAGLSAGRMLAEAGRDVMVIETRDRFGGRILTVDSGPEKLELAAESVHGKPPELCQLLKEAGLACY